MRRLVGSANTNAMKGDVLGDGLEKNPHKVREY